MSDKNLKSMLDSIIHSKDDDARVSFHSYLATKMKDVLKSVTGGNTPSNQPKTK